jgi:hypothetical protein
MHLQNFLYGLIQPLHIWSDHCVDISKRIQMKFVLHFYEVCTNFYKYLKFSEIFELV